MNDPGLNEHATVRLSVCVVTYNRAALIGTVLRGLGFADELIVVDKSSTDGTEAIARRYADRVLIAPWSPTVEETRSLGVAACKHDWILLLDDDELLTTATGPWIAAELRAPRAEIYEIPLRHYILGLHDERAYYWPEAHPRLFRRDAVELTDRVHGGFVLLSDRRYTVPLETGVCIHHLSHADMAQWVEKTNRYTSRSERVRMDDGQSDLAAFAHGAIDHWQQPERSGKNEYPAAVGLARAVYDIVDRLKGWEAENAAGGTAQFAEICQKFDAAYAAAGLVRERNGRADPLPVKESLSGAEAIAQAEMQGLRAALRQLRATTEARLEAERAALANEWTQTVEEVRQQAEAERAELTRHWELASAEQTRNLERAAEDARQEAATRIADLKQSREEAWRRTEYAEILATEATLQAEHKEQIAAAASERLGIVEGSTIWRATGPLRTAGTRFPFIARNLRKGTRLGKRALTMRLPGRLVPESESPNHGLPAVAPANASVSATARALGGLVIPSSETPMVSVIISTYGQRDVTLNCLRSIAEHRPNCPIEVIAVDDAYPGPEDMSILREVHGLHYIRNPTNLGFLLSCNGAARLAKGLYIYMLNNDTELLPGAIDTLVDLLEARPDSGMAGSKLLFPNGKLQEAGGILWTDASGWNYGRGQDPRRPEFNYVREVDYCSGASILIRRSVFEALKGFDEAFVPAYYEDSDLAFRIRAQGLKVLYQPRSEVIHHEGMSHGTDVAVGVKAHQVVNQARMLERWRDVLAAENYENEENEFRARDRARHRKVILIIDHYVPEPDRDAGSRSMLGIIDGLVDAGWLVKFWPHNRAYSPTYTPPLEERGIEVLDHRWPGELGTWMRKYGMELDHVMVSRPTVATDVLQHVMWNTDAVLSFYGHDLHFARIRREAMQDGNRHLMRKARAMERLEHRVWRRFDVVLYPSEEEASVVRTMEPSARAHGIVPFWFDVSPARTAPPQEHRILFVAGFAHPPNIDAARFLIHEIIPRLKRNLGPVKVSLVGSNPTDSVRALAGKDVEVTGYVTEDELCALYQQHRVAVVPLRFGAGVKGKVVEALSRGLPLVTTSIGAQGIVGLDQVVPVHDDPDGIAAALKLLLTDNDVWLTQSAAQLAFAQRFFSRAAMQRSVLSALESVEVSSQEARSDMVGEPCQEGAPLAQSR